jgi:hypothetical protein
MAIKRKIKTPVLPEGIVIIPPQSPDSEHPVLDPFPEVAYEEWPEPLKTAVLSGRIDVTTLPSPIFTKNPDETATFPYILNPNINLQDYE